MCVCVRACVRVCVVHVHVHCMATLAMYMYTPFNSIPPLPSPLSPPPSPPSHPTMNLAWSAPLSQWLLVWTGSIAHKASPMNYGGRKADARWELVTDEMQRNVWCIYSIRKPYTCTYMHTHVHIHVRVVQWDGYGGKKLDPGGISNPRPSAH